ncbi:MAG TPA: CNNM domain-containing protein, partial [Thauera aminoaromatica]|nr:CNNM domain-containing protein [Thauera aminoaromatica]
MTDLTLTLQIVALVVLLTLSACFSMSETVMMAANRYRLRSLANQGSRGATLALDLLARTDRLLGVILLFNNLVNTGAATLVSVITLELFGNESWILGVATLLATFAILVFSEITPKVVGANHADR